MLVQSIEVKFSNYGTNDRTLVCDYVLMGFEYIGGGPVIELLDFTLEEDFDDVRQTIELKVQLNLIETNWMQDWLATKNKTLTIDGVDYQVVSDFRDLKWQLFRSVMGIGTHPVLKFKAKAIGIVTPENILSGLEVIVE